MGDTAVPESAKPAKDVIAALGRGATVVTATQRLARHLRWRFDRSQAAQGLIVWASADILPWDAWIGRLWAARVMAAGQGDAGDLLRDTEQRILWREVIAAAGDTPPGDEAVLASVASAAWQLCTTWDIHPVDLRLGADSADSAAFARWVDAYLARCRTGNRLDPGMAAAALAEECAGPVTAGVGHEILFAGFDPWPPVRARLAGLLASAGVAVGRGAATRRSLSACRVECASPEAELALAGRWARTCLERDPSASVGIVVPNLGARGAAVRRACLETLVPGWQLNPPGQRPVSVSLGHALADHPLIYAALLLLRAGAGGLDWQAAGQLLRSRHLRGADAERGGRAAADLALREGTLAVFALRDLVNLCREPAPGLATSLERLFARLAALPPGPASSWASAFNAALVDAGWPGDRPLDSDDFQAVSAWQDVLASFGACDRVLGRTTLEGAVDAVLDIARGRPFEPRGRDDGVQVLGILEAEGQEFDHLWICGVTGDIWPPANQPNPLIPLHLQRQRGLPEASATLALGLAERRFERLLDGAGTSVCSWFSRSRDEEVVMSPLLARLPAGDPAEFAADGRSSYRETLAQSAPAITPEPDAPPPLRSGACVRGGARVLSLQAVCPARAFCESRLQVRELGTPRPPLDNLMRGRIVHRLLERLYAVPACRHGLAVVDEVALRGYFDAIVGQVLAEFLPRQDRLMQRLRGLEQDRLWILVLAVHQLDSGRGEFTVATEQPRDVSLGSLQLRLRLDRIDELQAGGLVVIDYKTGEFHAQGWKTQRLEECQLPLYATTGDVQGIAVVHFQAIDVRMQGVAAAVAGMDQLMAPERFIRGQDLDWPGLVSRWRGQLAALADEFAGGDFRIDPDNTKPARGQFALLTRVHELPVTLDGDEP